MSDSDVKIATVKPPRHDYSSISPYGEITNTPTTLRELRTCRTIHCVNRLCEALVNLELELFNSSDYEEEKTTSSCHLGAINIVTNEIARKIGVIVQMLNDAISCNDPPFSSRYGIAYDVGHRTVFDYDYDPGSPDHSRVAVDFSNVLFTEEERARINLDHFLARKNLAAKMRAAQRRKQQRKELR
jgi:hypothetical protein